MRKFQEGFFLAVNCGSSSIKMALFGWEGHQLRKKRDGHLKNLFRDPLIEINGKKVPSDGVIKSSYPSGIQAIFEAFKKEGADFSQLKGIGHRVVHGGEKYTQSVFITSSVRQDIELLSELAPLHNPPSLKGIECTIGLFPNLPQIAVFDTAFHAQLPSKAAYYPIPWNLTQKHRIKRYGFHGIAHAFSYAKYKESFGKEGRVMHLANGCSLTAIEKGMSVDTSMGFTPLDGLMMGTRSGELDPAIVSFLCEKENKSAQEIVDLLNTQSGLLGVSQKTADMQEIVKKAAFDPQIKLALDLFVYRIQKKIGSFIAALQGVDAHIFSGGIGENGWEIRKDVIDVYAWCSIFLDAEKNRSCVHLSPGEIRLISRSHSKIEVYVVGSDENAFIIKELVNLL